VQTQSKVYWTAEIAKRLEVSPPTINRWTHALEKLGYQVIVGTEGRAYTEEDIEVLSKMRDLMKNGPKTKTIEVARQVLNLGPGEFFDDIERTRSTQFQTQSSERDESSSVVQPILSERDRVQLIQFINSYQDTVSTLQNKINALENELQTRPNDRQIREEQMALWNLEHQIEAELRKEAESKWADLPNTEREHRIFKGVFPKRVENLEKKRWFIFDYVTKHKQERVLKYWDERQTLLKQKLNQLTESSLS
jgi:DNA-binding transcriptional MerR regulator